MPRDPLSFFPEEASDTPLRRPVLRAVPTGQESFFPADSSDPLTDAMARAGTTKPDTAARIFKLQLKTGLPHEVIARNLDEVEKQAARSDFDAVAFRKSSPVLAAWLDQHPLNASMASDDLIPLTAIERVLGIGRNVSGALAAGVAQFSQGIWGAVQAGAETVGATHSPSLPIGLLTEGNVDLYRQPAVRNPDGSISTVDSFSANIDGRETLLPTVMTDGRHLTPEDAIAEFKQTGKHLGVFTTAEAATAYAQQLHEEYAAGKYATGFSSKLAAFAAGSAAVAEQLASQLRGTQHGAGFTERGIYGGIESMGQMAPGLGLGLLAGPAAMLGLAGVTTGGQAYSQAREQGVGVGTSLAFGGFQGAVEVATEFIPAHRLLADVAIRAPFLKLVAHQIAPEIAGEEVATALQDLGEWATLPSNKERTFTDYLKDRPSAAAATAISTIVATGLQTGVTHGTIRMLEALGTAASESKTIQRSPEAAQAFIAQATAGSPVETVYAPLESWQTYWQSQGMDPAKMAADVTGSVEAYPNAAREGSDLPIPLSRYVTQLAKEHGDFFKNELRLKPDEMTGRELAAFEQQVKTQPVEAPSEPSPVRAAVLEQLTAAHVPTKTAESYADLYEAAIGTLAERAGVTPEGLYAQYGLKITRPDLQGLEVGHVAAEQAPAEVAGEPPATQPRLDTGTTTTETEGAHGTVANRAAGVGAGEAGSAAGHGVAASVPRDRERVSASGKTRLVRETAEERTQRETAHYEAVAQDLITQARRIDPAADPTTIRAELTFRLDALKSITEDYLDSGHDPLDLLRAIAKHGGLGPESAGGLTGELRDFAAGQKFGALQGVRNVFRAAVTKDDAGRPVSGLPFDVMVQRLQQDPRFAWIDDVTTLMEAIDEVVRNPPQADRFPGTDELKAVHIDPATAWWRQPWRVAEPMTEEGGDISFDVTQFGQSLFDALEEMDADKAAAAIAEDELATGETQPRLPGDVGTVREQEVATPEFEAPFALTSEAAQRKGKQTTLFKEERGYIRFGRDRQMNIALLARADLTTFLHESGHFFLEVFTDLANDVARIPAEQRTETQQQLLADHAAVAATLVDEDHAGSGFSTKQHEQFARTFEAYLMEGKAPSVELQGAFSRFRAWLVGIYRSLRNLKVELTPEVRQVFDRMLASDLAIADAEARRGVPPMFTTPESAGMTPEEFGLYRRTVEQASLSARETLDRRLMAEVQREQTATWKAQRAEIEGAVSEEVYALPEYQALAAIQRGEHPNGEPLFEGMETEPLKLSKALIVDRYGEERLKRLPRPFVYTVEGGLDPNAVAEMFGFSSGDALLTALEQAPPMKRAIAQETNRRQLAEHGSLLLDGSLHEAAQAAIGNEERDTVVLQELRALARLRRTVDPFVKAERARGREDLQAERAEREYERRWFDAEAKLRVAQATQAKQTEVDRLEQQVRDLRAKARGGAAVIRAAIPPAAQLRDAAKTRIASLLIRSIQPQAFWAASRRAATQAIERAARQDFDGAIVAKQQELINLNLYREAERVLVEVDDRVRYARDLARPAMRVRLGLAGGSYLDQVDGILDRFGFAKASQRTLDRLGSLRDWLQALETEGLPVEDIPQELLDEARRRNYAELSVEEFMGVTDGLKDIVHLASLKNRLLKSQDTREFNAVRDGVADSIRTNNAPRSKRLEFRPADEKWRRVSAWFASHTKISEIAQSLDGYVDGGPMWDAFMRPLNAAADAEATRKGATGKAFRELLNRHYPGRELGTLQQKVEIAAIGDSLSKEARLAVALNWGNQTSRDRMVSDPVRHWGLPQVQAILDTLDQRDWNFVQDTWNLVNTFWAEIAAKQERVTGLAPEKVEALPVTTRFGEYAGGYYPLAYDSRLSVRAGQHEAASQAKLTTAAAYVRSTTKRGHVEARKQNVMDSVRLELGVAFNHFEQVIHDLTHHEALIDVTRLIRDPKISQAIMETQGDIVYQQLTSALQDIAIGSTPAARNVMDASANWMRTGSQIAGLGWNLWTAAQQPLGIFNGMSRVGPTWVAKGLASWLRDAASMENTSAWISEKSAMMRERSNTASQDLQELKTEFYKPGGWFDGVVRTVSGDRVTQATIIDSYLWHIGLMQRVADIPTWLGQYEKSMAGGVDEATAIALADQAVLDSQGGGQVKDLAQVQRGGPIARLFMTFYSYGSTVFNATHRAAGQTNFRSPASIGTFLGHLSLLYVMPSLASVALSRAFGRSGGDDDTPEEFIADVGREMLSTALNTMVFVRELGGLAFEGARGYSGPAGARVFQLAYDLGTQVKQMEPDEGLAKAVNNAAGIIFRYPALQVQRSVDGWVALESGKAHNPLVLLTGQSRAGRTK